MHERVERAIAAIVPGEVIEMPAGRRVQVVPMPDGTICRMGHRIAVRNCQTARLSYIDAVALQRLKDGKRWR
jgi:hypothetical protein